MKKLFSALLVSIILVTLFCGCSNEGDENTTNNTTASVTETTETTATSTSEAVTELTTETTTQQDTVTTTEEKTTVTTTEKVITTQKPTTTATITKKETTTQKPTTTKPTTTAPYYCDEGGTHHRLEVGQIGWHNSYGEAMTALNSYMDIHGEGHYTIESCTCGLYTAFIKYPEEQAMTTKSTTTKKETTTEPYYCDEGGTHHRRSVGQIGWCNSYNEAMEAVRSYIIEHPEYKHYTIEECTCGLYTASLEIGS